MAPQLYRLDRLFYTLAVCALLAAPAASAQDAPTTPGTPDPTTVPVKDDVLATADGAVLKLVLATRTDAAGPAIPGVRLGVFDRATDRLVAEGLTDRFGFLTVRVPFEGSYRVETCHPEYFTAQSVINDCGADAGDAKLMCVRGFDFFTYDDALDTIGADHILKADFYLDSLAVGQIVDLDRIYYDFDKATLRPESREELDQLVRALELLPSLEIELRSHTDSRGTDAYNQDLSQRRAQSVVDYLVAAGIARERFGARGFGESRLLNECADGVECTEEQHQRNRRTEFAVTAYQPQPCDPYALASVPSERE